MRSNSAAFSDHDNEDFDDKQSRFTDYSMSSSVMRRNAGLALVDDRFEQVSTLYFSSKCTCWGSRLIFELVEIRVKFYSYTKVGNRFIKQSATQLN